MLEAGFSPTEIFVLKRLVEDDATTLRQLASKTGKSTGVLDQAIKKLLQKEIITKETINGSTKYSIQSLQAVTNWMEADTKKKRETLLRRHQNFESFIASLKLEKIRPEMQFYEGLEGFEQAYRRLLEPNKEWISYVPVICATEDDPMRDFRVELFRERHKRGIFSREIAHDSALGRRRQTRDPFEYRQTLLVPEKEYPFTFEKIIVGDTVACFNHSEKRACFIKFPELAETERAFFEMIWRHRGKPIEGVAGPEQIHVDAVTDKVPLSTKTLSNIREFFLSKKSLVTMIMLGLFAGALTFGMFMYTQHLNFIQMQEKVKAIAATGVLDIDSKDIDALQVESDYLKPEWAKVVNALKRIRLNNSDITFVYIFRKSKDDPTKLEFVSDSHSMNPYANTDKNPNNDVDADNNGKIEPEGGDKLQWPGQSYPIPHDEVFSAFNGPTATSNFYEDSWGRYLTGYAPIKDISDKTVAVLAVDMREGKLGQLNAQSFTPLLFFFGLFIFFILVRLFSFNRSLLVEMWQMFQMKKVLILLLIFVELSFGITYILYFHTLSLVKEQIGQRLVSIASTAAPEFNPNDLDKLRLARDMKTDEYQRVFASLNAIRNNNKDIKWIYIERTTDDPRVVEFAADADSNYNLPFWNDLNHDGIEQPDEDNVAPGVRLYDANLLDRNDGFLRPVAEPDFYSSQWGTYLSGYAPIKHDRDGVVTFLGIDMEASEIVNAAHQKFSPWLWFLGVLGILIVLALLSHFRSFNFRSKSKSIA